MIDFLDLTPEELWDLRREVVINSSDLNDYTNSFGFPPQRLRTFFDGYLDYMHNELGKGASYQMTIDELIEKYDTPAVLSNFYHSTKGLY